MPDKAKLPKIPKNEFIEAPSKKTRDDGVLYSGINSQIFEKTKKDRQKKQGEKNAKRAELLPAGDIIKAAIQRMRDELTEELRTVVFADTKDQDVKSLVLGIKFADQKLIRLNMIVNNALRKPKKEKDDEVRSAKKES